MESTSPTTESKGIGVYLRSPTIVITLILISVYMIVAVSVGDFVSPITTGENNGNLLVLLLMQCDAPSPIFPWTILTTVFLHVNVLHIASNLLFLIFFGFILEERVSKSQWLMTFFITGVVGSISFVGYDFVLSASTGIPNPGQLDCAVGASGAVYGIMGTAVGLRVFVILLFLLGLNLFAGGGGPAHLGGLVAGLVLRKYWDLGSKPFRGI